jgi:hypothetical protein
MSFRLFQLSQKFPGENLRHVCHLQDYATTADALPQASRAANFRLTHYVRRERTDRKGGVAAIRMSSTPRFLSSVMTRAGQRPPKSGVRRHLPRRLCLLTPRCSSVINSVHRE